MKVISKTNITLVVLLALNASQAFAQITGSLTQSELVSMNETAKTDGNRLYRDDEANSEAYDRLQFSSTHDYDFKQEKKIPAYLGVKITKTKRLLILPDQRIRFLVKNESLIENIQSLLSHTSGSAYFHSNFPKSFRFYNDFYVTGDNVAAIMDQLIEPWRAKHNAHATTHLNNVVEFTVSN